MSENATHIIIRHYIDGASSLYFSMVCCIILIIVVVIIMCFFFGFAIYMAVISKKSQQLTRDKSSERLPKQRETHLARNSIEDSSSYNALGASESTTQQFDTVSDPNVQSIPLSTFRRHTVNDRADDSEESSAGLYNVLFPGKHRGEIVYKPPAKLVTFAGQVYASGEGSSQANLISGPSTSRTGENASGSLEWDYFQQDNDVESVQSDGELETESKTTQTLSWV